MEKQFKNGFTLIELMVALVIAAILLGVGIPSFSNAIANSRMSGTYNDVAQALYIARSEAVKGSERIKVCPRATGDANVCGTDWTDGILVFVDNDPVYIDAVATFGPEDEALYVQREYRTGSTIRANQVPTRNGTTFNPTFWLEYSPTGEANWGRGTIEICDDDRGGEFSKAVNIEATGDIRRGRPVSATDKTPENVMDAPICQ